MSATFEQLEEAYGDQWTPEQREQARHDCEARAAETATERTEFELTDSGNAERFAHYYAPKARYCPDLRCWLFDDGKRWARDEENRVRQAAKQVCRRMKATAADLDDSRLAKELFDHAHRSESDRGISAMVKCAESERSLIARAHHLDPDPWMFNVGNGTLDLRTGDLLAHDRGRFITKLANVIYDATAECPTFNAFLNRTFAGNVELIGFLRRFIGYTLTGLTTEQIFVLLYGTGANGKSTLLEILRRLMGDYAMNADFSTFLAKRADGPRNDIARFEGARLVTAIEAGEGRRMDEAVVKSLTGGDTITARKLYSEAREFRPAFKLVFAANHRPVIKGDDHGIWRRVRLLPFEQCIPDEERDPHLIDKLTAELPGILAWAVVGCMEFQAVGLGTPAEVIAATADYRQEQDTLGEFIGDRCHVGPKFEAGATLLYTDYRKWCEANGETPRTQTAFGRQLRERGFQAGKTSTKRWLGIGLIEVAQTVREG